MNDWQHQQQLDEQERLEEIERLLDEGQNGVQVAMSFAGHIAPLLESSEWRKEIEAAIGLSKTPKPDKVEKF